MESHCRELELDAKLAGCMNEAQATEAIKVAEVSHAAWIKEAKVCHTTTIKEAKLCHTTRIKEAEVCHTTNSSVLQQTHRESMLPLECEANAEEGWGDGAFMEVSTAALHACLPETCGALMYPLQLLTSNVPLATILGMPATTQPQAVAGSELMSTASIPSVSEMPAPLMGTKWWHHSFDQGGSKPARRDCRTR